MKKSWPIFLLVFTMFTALTAVQGYYGLAAIEETNRDAQLIHQEFRVSAKALTDIETLMLQSAILIRDILLHPDYTAEQPLPLDQLAAVRTAIYDRLKLLRANLSTANPNLLAAIEKEIDLYWEFLELTDWKEIHDSRESFLNTLQEEITPKRFTILALTEDVALITSENLKRESLRLNESIDQAKRNIWSVLALTMLASVVATGFAVTHVRSLEESSAKEHENLESAKDELRRLTLELVSAGEKQRKALSLELHDQVGQNLTALKLSISGLERIGDPQSASYKTRYAELKTLVEDCIKTVRHISMGLRPSILDDLGLGPALEWLARDFGRQTGLKVEVSLDPKIPTLMDEAIRTNLYRISQEALTNVAKHSGGAKVSIAVRMDKSNVTLTIEDDGIGFESDQARQKGLGLIGMDERVKKFNGTLSIDSRLYVGTRITIKIPLPAEGEA